MLLWDVLARSSAVLLAAALVNAALRGRSAALRHAVWACGLAGALAVAPLSWVLPTWRVPLLPAAATAPAVQAVAAAPAPQAALEPAATVPDLAARVATRVGARLPSRVVDRVPSRILDRVPSRAAARLEAAAMPDGPGGDGPRPGVDAGTGPARGADAGTGSAAAPTAAAPGTSTASAAPQLPWGALLLGVWALGSLLLLGRLAWANLLTFRALRIGTSTAPPWLATARRLARLSGVPHTRFVRAESITMPMAAGYLRPTVALPAEADAWPTERLTSVLLHELAHIRRRDCLTQLAASTACALYWMNPLAWHAAKALRRERERACDDAVLAAGTAGPTYAEHLLDVARAARHVTTPTWSGGVAMAHRSELEGRLMAILDDARNRQSVSYGAAGLAGLLCFALVTPLAALDPWALSAAEAQPARVAIPPGAGPERPAPKTPRPPAPPRVATVAVAGQGITVTADALGLVDATEPLPALAPIAAVPPAPPVSPVPVVAATASVAPLAPLAILPPTLHVPAMAFAFDVDVDMDWQSLPTPAPTPTPTPTPTPSPAVSARTARADRPARREAVPADPRVIAALGGALKDADVEVRQQAAHSLGQMRDVAAVDALLPALQDTDVEVRQNVVFALGQLRDARAIPGLTIALKDANEEVRQRAAFALSQLRDPRAVEPLLIAARDASPSVRRQALFAIGQIDATRGKDIAIEALKDKDADVRRMAAHLLGRLAHER